MVFDHQWRWLRINKAQKRKTEVFGTSDARACLKNIWDKNRFVNSRIRRYELHDNQWDAIKELFPDRSGKHGHEGHPPRQLLNALFWILSSEASWRDLSERYIWLLEDHARIPENSFPKRASALQERTTLPIQQINLQRTKRSWKAY